MQHGTDGRERRKKGELWYPEEARRRGVNSGAPTSASRPEARRLRDELLAPRDGRRRSQRRRHGLRVSPANRSSPPSRDPHSLRPRTSAEERARRPRRRRQRRLGDTGAHGPGACARARRLRPERRGCRRDPVVVRVVAVVVPEGRLWPPDARRGGRRGVGAGGEAFRRGRAGGGRRGGRAGRGARHLALEGRHGGRAGMLRLERPCGGGRGRGAHLGTLRAGEEESARARGFRLREGAPCGSPSPAPRREAARRGPG